MDYWETRARAAKLVPRIHRLPGDDGYRMKEKGRKSNYQQYNLDTGNMDLMERLLDQDNINSFAEVSLRAQSCPMPFNIDVWDGLKCPYNCKYCFADYFRASLYTSFFDNGKKLGLRHSSPEQYQAELDKLLPHVGEKVDGENAVLNAVRLRIPMRLGIRFEDFTLSEKKHQISLGLLRYLRDAKYPVMINTKSDLVGEGPYTEALAGNPAGAAVHITLLSSDEKFLKAIEPAAPTFKARLKAARALTDAGIRVVARIEPWMIFLNDSHDKVDEYIGKIKEAGIQHLTLDSYSYSAYSKGIAENFYQLGFDFDRMFMLSSDSQWLSSLLLGKFIEYFRANGLKASTFDQGNVVDNDDWICCSVGDYFGARGAGFNWGSGVIAIRFIKDKAGKPVRWSAFEAFVKSKGGWLSSALRQQVYQLWNGEGDAAWPIYWSRGLEAIGHDADGVVWKFNAGDDYREDLLTKGGLL